MEQEEDSIHGVIRRVILRSSSILSLSNFQDMENREGREKRRSGNMPNMFMLF